MKTVKRSLIGGYFLLAACIAAAESVTVTTVNPSESSRRVRITVVLNGKPVKGAKLYFCKIPEGENCFSVVTGEDGVAVPQVLSAGNYHVAALFDENENDLYLHVSTKSRAHLFSIDLTESFQLAQEAMAAAQKLPIRETVQRFRGFLQDPSGAFIAGVEIKVIPRESEDRASILRLKSDADGRFFAQLPEGAYVAFFSMQGFRTEIVPFEIAAQGEKEMAVKLSIGNMTESLPVSASR